MKTILLSVSAVLLAINVHAQPYNNGGLSTGATSNSGVAAPAGSTWSEVQNETGNTTYSNTSAGAAVSGSGGFFLADDFIIPAGEQWNLQDITVFAYQTGYGGAASPIVSATMQIFDGDPSVAASTSVFGDDTTNVLSSSTFTNMYRIFNSAVPAPGSTPGTTRKIWSVNTNTVKSLLPGTYWIKYQVNNAAISALFAPSVTIKGIRGLPTFNAQQYVGATATWQPSVDVGNPDAAAPDIPNDFPFIINYTVTLLGTTESRQMDNRVRVYPNPTSDLFKIALPDDLSKSNTTISLYDMSGKMVKEFKVADSYNISDLPKGQYMIKIKDGSSNKVTKLIKN